MKNQGVLLSSILCLLWASSTVAQTSAPFVLTAIASAQTSQSGSDAQLLKAQQFANTDSVATAERNLRSNLVALAMPATIADRATDSSQKRIRLDVFPGISFVAEESSHAIGQGVVRWLGTIVEGGSGTVTLQVVKDSKGRQTLFANIRSNVGDFNIYPTDTGPYHVAAESNRYLREKLD